MRRQPGAGLLPSGHVSRAAQHLLPQQRGRDVHGRDAAARALHHRREGSGSGLQRLRRRRLARPVRGEHLVPNLLYHNEGRGVSGSRAAGRRGRGQRRQGQGRHGHGLRRLRWRRTSRPRRDQLRARDAQPVPEPRGRAVRRRDGGAAWPWPPSPSSGSATVSSTTTTTAASIWPSPTGTCSTTRATSRQRQLRAAQPALRNDGGRFRDVGRTSGRASRSKVSRTLAAGDIDNDGDLDLLVSNNGQSAESPAQRRRQRAMPASSSGSSARATVAASAPGCA